MAIGGIGEASLFSSPSSGATVAMALGNLGAVGVHFAAEMLKSSAPAVNILAPS